MKVRVVAVGRLKGPVGAAAEHYRTRAARYWTMEVREEREGKGQPQDVAAAEGRAILKSVGPRETLWALSRGGRAWSSADWTRNLERVSVSAYPTANIAIGGAWGLSDEVLERADVVVSLASATLPHDVARLVLYEQLYRALAIESGIKYHR